MVARTVDDSEWGNDQYGYGWQDPSAPAPVDGTTDSTSSGTSGGIYAPPPDDSTGTANPQVQDPWGRSPGDPDYGKDPNAPTTTTPTPSAKFGGGWDAPGAAGQAFQEAINKALTGNAVTDYIRNKGIKDNGA